MRVRYPRAGLLLSMSGRFVVPAVVVGSARAVDVLRIARNGCNECGTVAKVLYYLYYALLFLHLVKPLTA